MCDPNRTYHYNRNSHYGNMCQSYNDDLSRLCAVVGTRRGRSGRSGRTARSGRSSGQSDWLKWLEQLGEVHPQILILVSKKNDLVISPDQFVSMTSREGLTYSFSKLYLLKTTRRLYGLCVLRSFRKKSPPQGGDNLSRFRILTKLEKNVYIPCKLLEIGF